ncbi:MAG: twin-arginine translocase subunit TatC [Marinilabiliales bacterium]|nr:MAG: twin-arginine translocase subunit TatC [Marinilabiliales bacterium]
MVKKVDNEMSFLDHLEDLRWHLVRSIMSIIVFAIVAFIFKDFIFTNVIIAPKTPEFFTNRSLCSFGTWIGIKALCINSEPFQLININMAGQFTTHIMVSMILGLILAFPYLVFEMWRFIGPALYDKEKMYARGGVFYISILFILGVLFAYYVIIPLSVHFLGTYQVSAEVTNQINLISYISTVTAIALAVGLIFELPVLIYFLTKIGLVSPEFLKKYRRHALVVLLMLSAIITPPDVFSQILVVVPLMVLYEVGIRLSKSIVKKEQLAARGAK